MERPEIYDEVEELREIVKRIPSKEAIFEFVKKLTLIAQAHGEGEGGASLDDFRDILDETSELFGFSVIMEIDLISGLVTDILYDKEETDND